jgi:hypothetical protein
MHTEWKVSGLQPMTVYATEVARRQPDGTWCWLMATLILSAGSLAPDTAEERMVQPGGCHQRRRKVE